jgi:protein phosphatase
MVANRYLYQGDRIFLDTLPGYYPTASADRLPESWLTYLRLMPQRVHVPQLYDAVVPDAAAPGALLVLLEGAAVWVPRSGETVSSASGDLEKVYPLPAIAQDWPTASPQRQLNWLWQMANLWQPLSVEQVASTLLNPELIRVEESLVRLLELQPDQPGAIATLPDLGRLWQQWATAAHPTVAAGVQHLSQALVDGSLSSAAQVTVELDQQLRAIAPSIPRTISLATATDKGPTRARNEDACYPPSGTVSQTLPTQLAEGAAPMVIVCDGIGGHQGGDVASGLAIASIQQHVQPLPLANLEPDAIHHALIQATAAANNQISQRNDSEQRQDRQRMGTTLVMGLVRQHELYLAHVGDSRAYWITRRGCHQITLDDDVATREVRLGYSLHREALQHPSSGSLIQALGMNDSALLHPTVQRFVLDEDCIVLLCSDGLSDGDRVEQFWDVELAPLLASLQPSDAGSRGEREVDLGVACQRLVDLANRLNGHDNVTLGILHCQVEAAHRSTPSPVKANAIPPSAPAVSPQATWMPPAHALSGEPDAASAKTQRVAPAALPARRSPLLSLLGALLLVLALGAGGLYLLSRYAPDRLDAFLGRSPRPVAPDPDPDPAQALQPGALIELGRSADPTAPPVVLSPQPPFATSADVPAAPFANPPDSANLPSPPPTAASPGDPGLDAPVPELPADTPLNALTKRVPPGSILQLVSQQGVLPDRWLQVRVCSVGTDLLTQPVGTTQTPPLADPAGANAAPDPALNAEPDPPLPPEAVVQAGEVGWVAEPILSTRWRLNQNLTPEQQGRCATDPVAPNGEATPSPADPTSPLEPSPAEPLEPLG